MTQFSSNRDYTDVKCIKEVPDRPFFTTGSVYSSKESNRGHGRFFWVGIPGQGGYDFKPNAFDQHFQKVL